MSQNPLVPDNFRKYTIKHNPKMNIFLVLNKNHRKYQFTYIYTYYNMEYNSKYGICRNIPYVNWYFLWFLFKTKKMFIFRLCLILHKCLNTIV